MVRAIQLFFSLSDDDVLSKRTKRRDSPSGGRTSESLFLPSAWEPTVEAESSIVDQALVRTFLLSLLEFVVSFEAMISCSWAWEPRDLGIVAS